MLPFLKKKSEAAAAPQVPAWHANFRNFEKLPDTKVVRTAFFINGAAITLALVALTYFGYQEWNLHVLKVQIADRQKQIDRDKRASEQAVALFKKFQAEEAKVLEVDGFVKSKPSFADLVSRLGQTLPPNVAIDNLELRESGLSLRLTIKGSPTIASQTASNYLEQLQKDPELGKLFDKFEFASNPSRNATTGRLAVEFLLILKGAKK